MSYLKLIIASILILITSCSLSPIPDDAYITERRFIDYMLRNPEKLDSIIDSNIYYSAKYRKTFLNNDTLRKYSSYMEKFKENGYLYYYFDERISTYGVNVIRVQREVKIKCRDKDLYLNFFFITENDTMRLSGLSMRKETLTEWYNHVHNTKY